MTWAPLRDDAETRRWLDRFQGMSDGVLRRVDVRYRSASSPARAIVEVSARDTMGGCEWTNVLLEVRGLTEHVVSEGGPRGSYQILSNGLHVVRFEGLVFVELGHYADPPHTVELVRQSACYLAGSELFWELVPYS